MEHMSAPAPGIAFAPRPPKSMWENETMMDTHNCDGSPLSLHGGGTWGGHFVPGLIFVSWGLWWMYHTFRLHILHRTYGDSFASQGWYTGLTWWCRYLEPFLKVFGGPVGILVELRLDHSYFLNLLCQEDGSFAMQHIHNWQHASSYPAFIVSGIVDWIGMYVTLPDGMQQAFLALAFFLEGFLMLMHKKHEAFDAVLHWLLGCTMWAAAAFVGLELHRGNTSFLASVGRAFSCLLQGFWFMQMGQMLFTGNMLWQTGPGAIMMAPVAFAMLMLTLAVAMLLFYLCLQRWLQRQNSSYASLEAASPAKHSKQADLDLYSAGFGGDDSANEQSDGSEGHTTPPTQTNAPSHGPGGAKQQLMTALHSLRGDAHKAPPKKRDEHII